MGTESGWRRSISQVQSFIAGGRARISAFIGYGSLSTLDGVGSSHQISHVSGILTSRPNCGGFFPLLCC